LKSSTEKNSTDGSIAMDRLSNDCGVPVNNKFENLFSKSQKKERKPLFLAKSTQLSHFDNAGVMHRFGWCGKVLL